MLPYKGIKKLMPIFQPKVFFGCAVIGCIGLAGFFGINRYKSNDHHSAVTLYKTSQQRSPQERARESFHPAAPGHIHSHGEAPHADHAAPGHTHSHGEAPHAYETDGVPNRETYPWRDAETLKNQPEMAAATQHFQQFFRLIDTDPGVSRKELEAYTALLFQSHPLTEEWNKLFFRIVQNKGGVVAEVIRFMELKKRLLIDTNPEKFATQIRYVEHLLKELKRVEKLYESEGRLETQKIPFLIEYGK